MNIKYTKIKPVQKESKYPVVESTRIEMETIIEEFREMTRESEKKYKEDLGKRIDKKSNRPGADKSRSEGKNQDPGKCSKGKGTGDNTAPLIKVQNKQKRTSS